MPFASLLLLLFLAGFIIFVVALQMAIDGYSPSLWISVFFKNVARILVLLLKKHNTCIVLSVKINFVFHYNCIYFVDKSASATLISNATDTGKLPNNSILIFNCSSNDQKQFLLFSLWLCLCFLLL